MEAAADRGIADAELASKLGIALPQLTELFAGLLPITLGLAETLSATVGATREFWITRDAQYHDDLRRVEADQWAQRFPIAQMVEFGWISKPADWHERIDVCLQYFQVDEPAGWEARYGHALQTAHFRRSPTFDVDAAATSAWFRACEAQAERQSTTSSFDLNRFASTIGDLVGLTKIKDPARFVPQLIARCAEVGVGVVVVRPPRGCPVSGVARMYRGRPLIQLSARYLTDDHFWFSFFHEAGHVVLHPLDQIYVDSFDTGLTDDVEAEANAFAEQQLFPVGIPTQGKPTPRTIVRTAHANGVSNGVVVGQLQHCGIIKPGHFNDFKQRYAWYGPSLGMK
ncbi:ImmA/IrrE family metallo-endopeptidase [Mycobacteroides abscessus]|uniref:ImmA/IrrE family metallo-endopeptidase n=1 Tax=Mycobacteroides abscessus TaxID=36809 RepID=UPI000378DF10|nr:ImmA/IrrE family metallo-endopeptidase [Mycobacteroides abscessus]MDO2969903.1 ImmA/IrrE family metallo-endopeptidase [Mycobacteroides abscessus subsp. bolletii]MDO3079905.1 ImmA/IrrE family metallo-endopeptidase [Mycobacteroides abscessus subsp. bolletii]SKK68311.1 plasmid maintenance system antidote protein [Mycobacteroides abscessus subsp. bolletii]